MCQEDGLWADPKVSSFSYSDDYLLHYQLYARTKKSDDICRARWAFVASHIALIDKNLLDYGCGAGTFGMWWKEDCPDIYMYDSYFRLDHSFLDVDIDIVTLWDSFEHISRLDMLPLIGAKYIFMSLPIVDDVIDIVTWKHFVPHEHLWYFTTKALTRLFRKWGYKLVETSDFESLLRSPDIKSFFFTKL
jgi:hypothetical protein